MLIEQLAEWLKYFESSSPARNNWSNRRSFDEDHVDKTSKRGRFDLHFSLVRKALCFELRARNNGSLLAKSPLLSILRALDTFKEVHYDSRPGAKCTIIAKTVPLSIPHAPIYPRPLCIDTDTDTPLLDLHFDSLHFDSPGVRGLVQAGLHVVGDCLSLGQDLGQVSRAQHVAEGGRGQQAGGVAAHHKVQCRLGAGQDRTFCFLLALLRLAFFFVIFHYFFLSLFPCSRQKIIFLEFVRKEFFIVSLFCFEILSSAAL